jgi:6-phosphogluconolactonase
MNVFSFASPQLVAEAAAARTIDILSSAIHDNGHASWVLAGGSTPELAYEVIASKYLHALDWSKVTFLIGDERIGPLDGPDNNWHRIDSILLKHLPDATYLRPRSDLSAVDAASDYEALITNSRIGKDLSFDVTWLGMGPDGHTLSLFPDHKDFDIESTRLVIPIHDAPKQPPERISFTIAAVRLSTHLFVLATGESKRPVLEESLSGQSPLPIAIAAAQRNTTQWLVDKDATPTNISS